MGKEEQNVTGTSTAECDRIYGTFAVGGREVEGEVGEHSTGVLTCNGIDLGSLYREARNGMERCLAEC